MWCRGAADRAPGPQSEGAGPNTEPWHPRPSARHPTHNRRPAPRSEMGTRRDVKASANDPAPAPHMAARQERETAYPVRRGPAMHPTTGAKLIRAMSISCLMDTGVQQMLIIITMYIHNLGLLHPAFHMFIHNLLVTSPNFPSFSYMYIFNFGLLHPVFYRFTINIYTQIWVTSPYFQPFSNMHIHNYGLLYPTLHRFTTNIYTILGYFTQLSTI